MLLKWQVKKLGFQRLRDLLSSGMNYNIRQEKEKSVGRMSEKLEMTNNHFFKMFIWILIIWMRGTAVSKAYSEPSRTSKMELFARIANCFQPLTIS